jgi:DNA-binding CsgD family transcriptional regulator
LEGKYRFALLGKGSLFEMKTKTDTIASTREAAVRFIVKSVLSTLIVAVVFAASIIIRSELGGENSEFAAVVVYSAFFIIILGFSFVSHHHSIGMPLLFCLLALAVLVMCFVLVGNSSVASALSNAVLGGARGLSILLMCLVLSPSPTRILRPLVFLGATIAVLAFPVLNRVSDLSMGTIQQALFVAVLIMLALFMALESESLRSSSLANQALKAHGEGKFSWRDIFFSQSKTAQITLFGTIPFFFCSGFFSSFTLDHGYSLVYSNQVMYGLAAVLLALFVIDRTIRRKSWFNLLCFVIEAIIMVAIFFLLVFEDYPLELFGIMRAGVIVLIVWLLVFLSEVAEEQSLSPVFLYGVFALVCLLPHIVGDITAYLLLPVSADSGPILVSGTLLTIVVTAGVIIILLINNKILDTGSNSLDQATPRDNNIATLGDGEESPAHIRLKAICAQYGISEKESEVIYLYTQGRSVRSISSKLYVSESTVRTYIQRVYAKLDIHNRQSLLDILDGVE